MANSKLVLVSMAIALAIVLVRSDAAIGEPDGSASALRSEIDALRSKISSLESRIEDRIIEIRTKEDNIGQLNAVIQEKLARIASLESEIGLLQESASVEAEKSAWKADGYVGELEKQIVKLRTEIEGQSKNRAAMAARADEAEKKVQELNLRLESLQKTNEEQKLRIRKTERALELAEEELMRAQLESASKFKDLTKVHESWLPPWLATQTSHIQDLVVTLWNEYARPALVLILHKASEKLEQVHTWAKPHFNSAKTEWIPAAKEQLIIFKLNAKPCLHRASSHAFELYEASKRTISPQIVKLQEVAYLYIQEARVFSKPFVDHVVVVAKPHVEKLQLVLMPYTKHVTRAYRKSLKRARTCHRQVQENIHEELKKHEFTKPHASKEVAWFLASALVAFSIFFLYRVLASIFCKKAMKPRWTSHANHGHRRPKRRHTEK